MGEPLVSIIMRSFNEGWALRQTLPALDAQNYKNWELIVIDSGSNDGSVELLRSAKPAHLIQISPDQYNPSRVLNHGMHLAASDLAVFLNADATPQGPDWLSPLVSALQLPGVAAVFGRQISRPDCRAVYAHDYERCFPRASHPWKEFFSMASSGLRKEIWLERGFNERLQYSEDDELARWCRAQGYGVEYVPGSVAMHSHNYTPAQARKRSFGEGRALAAVWEHDNGSYPWWHRVLLGWLNDARRDLLYCAKRGRFQEFPHALRIRWRQRCGRWNGFHDGWDAYRRGADNSSRPRPPTWAQSQTRVIST